ncbi:FtsK/SpoIIIE domain-containing protein, partial [Verrucomicrobiota bacterium]
TVRDSAAREKELDQNFKIQTGAERQRSLNAAEHSETQQAETITTEHSSFKNRKDKIKTKYETRKARIRRAYDACINNLQQESSDKARIREGKLLKEKLQTDRTYSSEQKTADTILEEFTMGLAEDHKAYTELTQATQKFFKGYGKLLKSSSGTHEIAEPDLAADENVLKQKLCEQLNRARSELNSFGKFLLPRFFKHIPAWLIILLALLIHAAAVPILYFFEFYTIFPLIVAAAISMIVLSVVVIVLDQLGKRNIRAAAFTTRTALETSLKLHDICVEKSKERHKQELKRIEYVYKVGSSEFQQKWGQISDETTRREVRRQETDAKEKRLSEKNKNLCQAKLKKLEQEHENTIAQLKEDAEKEKLVLADTSEKKSAEINANYESDWKALEAEWKSRIVPIYNTVNDVNADTDKLFPEWLSDLWKNWSSPSEFTHVAKFAHMDIDVENLAGAIPQDKRLALPGSANLSLPLSLTFPRDGSILFDTNDSGRDKVVGSLNNIILRLFSVAPPGKISFTILDPVGLGQSFAGIMHLADYEESLVNRRIWTQPRQIEQQLADLNEHMEKVIQMYLRNEYESITEYNEQAGDIAEKYHFLVIADFPVNFSEVAAKRLLSIAASGARCGIFTLIHWDHRHTMPQDFVSEELTKTSICLSCKEDGFILGNKPVPGTKLVLDSPPDQDTETDFLHKVGQLSTDSNRVEVPFEHIVPKDSELWTADTTKEISVPVGRTGATKLQNLALGKDTRQHVLIAGKTGSGKSTLFHVLITNLSLYCSPEQVEFYLVDFKKGVEFKCYATKKLPHARVVAIESDRGFGLSVLQRVDQELKQRGDMFRKLGVQDIAGYKKAGGTEPVPRTLLIIDEFQEFFVDDDKISQESALLLDRIVRQGRAFGIHVLLGSQTLGGAYTLARTTLGQMVVRIALQCNEADSYLIMDDNNPAPRLLSRPGEAIYNDAAGVVEGNHPFQVVWLSDDVRDKYLDKVRDLVDQKQVEYPDPIVFEGNAPADIRENPELQKLLKADAVKKTISANAWLGAPNSIKGPTTATFQRQSGSNLIIVGQHDESALAIMAISLVSLAAQHPLGTARFIVFDGTVPGSMEQEFLEKITKAIPHEVILAKHKDTADIMNNLAAEIQKRNENENEAADAPATYVFVCDLPKFKKLRHEDDFGFSADEETTAKPGVVFNDLICEGASLGFHVIVTCDSYNNVNRFISRKALSEFEMRVLFQMSANDSASLIDSPNASKLGLHGAILYNDREGYIETFRPYALPDNAWIEETAQTLSRLLT